MAAARGQVRDILVASGRDDLVETASLLVSEVVTNALLHAGTDMLVAGEVGDDGLQISVRDGSLHLPSLRRYAATSGTGRGLLMLEALVEDWGVSRHEDGKTVWFRLDRAEAGDVPVAPSTDGLGADRDSVAVELRNMPLLLHAAWQEHSEALLREYLLVNLDTEGSDPIQLHAEATDAIAVLEEHVPRARLELVPDRVMDDATEPMVSAPRVQVRVPLESVPHFATLDRAIEAALDLSDEGLVLTPPTQPEVQAFRRWLCRQVLRQAAGGAPEPWQVPSDDRDAVTIPDGWDPTSVRESTVGLIAADYASRILAVSRPAAMLLGYDDPDELVGERVVSIVPERYRQAHVAGFTMYLLVGREPLMDRAIPLPALRRNGSEVPIELVVHHQPLGNGEGVLVAELSPAP
ncbi:MAG: PAS domain S-box protein [Nocardioidaceae bacterium]|nr:PAS domain S-box protein [Nocardioidaceae bacterium]NUS49508.1 PAS domain S-box protein [Nocardioidaceae bacterium]